MPGSVINMDDLARFYIAGVEDMKTKRQPDLRTVLFVKAREVVRLFMNYTALEYAEWQALAELRAVVEKIEKENGA